MLNKWLPCVPAKRLCSWFVITKQKMGREHGAIPRCNAEWSFSKDEEIEAKE